MHPLKLILQIHDDETSDSKPTKLIVLKFEYLLKLNVVCVGIEGSNDGPESNILCNLFPNDAGLELPQQVIHLLYIILEFLFRGGKFDSFTIIVNLYCFCNFC